MARAVDASETLQCPECSAKNFTDVWMTRGGFMTFKCMKCRTIFNTEVPGDMDTDGTVSYGLVRRGRRA